MDAHTSESIILCPCILMAVHNTHAWSGLLAVDGILPPLHHCHNFLDYLGKIGQGVSEALEAWN